MNELLETERAYVEELLCVLEVSVGHVGHPPPPPPPASVLRVGNACNLKLQGYAAEMDNSAMAHLIPSTLLNKKFVLFGNMSEIYQFHKRYAPLQHLRYAKLLQM